jgi:uncharacterized protein YbjT (DUF2867 family)
MILVTGATGTVGRDVVRQLLEAHAEVRPVSRSPERASLPGAPRAVRGDLAEPESLRPALGDVDRVFLFPAAAPLDPFLDLARDAGVHHVVLLSSSAAADGESNAIARSHRMHERAVAASGLSWTYIRPGAFMANDLMWAPAVRGDGVVRAPYAQAATTPIDERDIAAVAVRALLDEDRHAHHAYQLTGPESLTVPDRVEILGKVLGRSLRFEELDPAQARELMVARMPAPVADAVLGMMARAGSNAPVSPSVQQVTGRPPHTYADWVARNAAAWGSPSMP